MNRLLMDTASRLFADGAESEMQDRAERGEFPQDLWQQLEDNGLLSALLPEEAGGAGMTEPSVLAMMRVAGAQALAVPLAETLFGRLLLSNHGIEFPAGPICVVCTPPTDLRIEGPNNGVAQVHGRVRWPWPGHAHLLVLSEATLVLLEPGQGQSATEQEVPLAGEPNAVVTLGAEGEARVALETVHARALDFLAIAHCQKMAGAMERVLDLSMEHVQGREQFGRPLSRFQAVQHLVAQLAAETAVVGAAADSVTALFAEGIVQDPVAVAAAKARASEAAAKVSRIAHQLHGALGFTREHDLHRFTRRLLRYRDEFGDEGFWQARIGALAIAGGSQNVWALLCSE